MIVIVRQVVPPEGGRAHALRHRDLPGPPLVLLLLLLLLLSLLLLLLLLLTITVDK